MSTLVRVLIGACAGMLGGGALGYYGKCTSGTCPLTATPLRGAMFGALLGAAVGLSISTSGCSKCNSDAADAPPAPANAQIVQITTAEQFKSQVLEAAKPVLVDFYADWCAPCKALAPTIALLAGEYAGRVQFAKVNGDQLGELLREHKIEGYPTVLIFGGSSVERFVGLRKVDEYRAALDAAVSSQNKGAK